MRYVKLGMNMEKLREYEDTGQVEGNKDPKDPKDPYGYKKASPGEDGLSQ